MEDTLFIELFSVRFLIALSATKAIMKLDGLPIDVSLDDMMAYAREKEISYREKLDTVQRWWCW